MYADIIAGIWVAIGTSILAGLCWLLRHGVNWLKDQSKLFKDENLISWIYASVEAAVGETMQTYVDSIKAAREDGKLSKEEAQKAFAMAKAKALDILKAQGIEGVELLVSALIETYVKKTKVEMG